MPNASLAAETTATIEFTLPLDAVSKFASLLAKLESELVALRCKSYGISAGSLTSVFMRFADGGDLAVAVTRNVSGRAAEIEPMYEDIDGPLSAQPTAVPGVLVQLKAMIYAKFAITMKNKRAFLFAMLLPLILIFVSSRAGNPGKTSLPQDQSLTFGPDALHGSIKNTLPIALSQTVQDEFAHVQKWLQESTGLQVVCYDGSATCSRVTGQEIATSYLNSNVQHQTWGAVVLFEHTDVHHVKAGSTWEYTIMPNLLQVQVLPTMTNLINSAILKSDPNTQSLDLKTTSRSYASKPTDQLPFGSSNIFLAIALAAPATTFVAFIVRDKELKTRHQLNVMGLPLSVYWFGAFVHDSCLYSVTALGSVVIMVLMGTEPMGGQALDASVNPSPRTGTVYGVDLPLCADDGAFLVHAKPSLQDTSSGLPNCSAFSPAYHDRCCRRILGAAGTAKHACHGSNAQQNLHVSASALYGGRSVDIYATTVSTG